jgi:hypothetical protein
MANLALDRETQSGVDLKVLDFSKQQLEKEAQTLDFGPYTLYLIWKEFRFRPTE